MAEEEKVEATTPESNTEEFIDDNGLKHVVVRDAEGKPISDETFNKDGRLIEQGIYQDGSYLGKIGYSTDENGIHHQQVYDANGNLTWDMQRNSTGLIRETFYEKGKIMDDRDLVTHEHYHNPEATHENHVVEQKAYSISRFDDYLNPKVKPEIENTTLPAVRGQEMPARTQETQQEQPDLHPVRFEQTAETANTVLPAVRGNAMPERAQEPMVLEGQETNLVQSLGNYAQKPSKESLEAFALDLSNLVSEYRASGMSFSDATQKASKFLGQLYDRAESQNMDPQMLSNLREAKEAANKFMAQAAEASNAGPTMLNEVNAGRRNENIEDAVYEEMPTEPVVENEGNEAADTPVTPANENEGNEEDNAPVTPANENEGNEGDNAPVTPANENEGNDTPAPANENQGTFGFIENEPEKENTPSTENGPAAEPAKTSDLKQQLLNTAFKNRYMLVEAENEEPQRMCPFAQLKVRTIEDKSDDEKNPYVKMELESGNRIYNRPNQVDVHYETFVTKDENGQTVRKPQITFEDCMAAVRVGMEKGWTSATLSGPDAYKEQMYLAMCAMGMKVVGYEPSEELKKEGERLAKLHAVDRDHAASVDQRFDALEAARKEAGIKEPEEIGKEFIDDMKERGLGYTPPVQNNENDSNESDGNDTAGTPPDQNNKTS